MTSPVADPAPPPTSEPVLIAHAVTVILAALVSLGWISVPDVTIDLVGTGVALVISTVAVVVARGRVQPLAKAGALDGDAVRLLVAEVVRTELATLAAYRTATNNPQASQAPPQLTYPAVSTARPAHARVDWMGRPNA